MEKHVKHVFRFPLQRRSTAYSGSLNEFLGRHLQGLRRLLIPLSGQNEVTISGYRLFSDPGTDHALPDEARDLHNSAGQTGLQDLCEPRLSYISDLIESLSCFVDFESQGQVVSIDGFRIKDLNPWLVPGGGASDIVAAAASRCNLSCQFCYNRGAPGNLRSKPRDPEAEYAEIVTRIEQYVPQGRLHIFPGVPGPCESLSHPYILAILRKIRDKTSEPLRIATNGSLLTPEMIKGLQAFAPIYLDISLNSSSSERRRYLMRDPHPEVSIHALSRLATAKIPYSIVIVPWPLPSQKAMLDDLEKTVLFTDKYLPTCVQISLPGYSRFFSKKTLFNHEKVWGCLKKKVVQLREKVRCPLVMRPGLFEEYEEPHKVQEPMIIGTIKNSPAAGAGLQRGDQLLKINGLKVVSRHHARSLLSLIHEGNLVKITITFKRGKTTNEVNVYPISYDYPYSPEAATHLGIVFSSSGIPETWMEYLRGVIIARGASRVLVLTSRLVSPTIRIFLSRTVFPPETQVYVRVPENSYWGGNIFMGDLMVVQDFIDEIKKCQDQEGFYPELVIVPSSPFHLSGWGRDLTGRIYQDIEKETGIPVVLLHCSPLFD